MKKSLFVAILGLPLVVVATERASAQITIVSHRAIYDLDLASSTGRSGISGADGRMAMEITGSSCDGWTVNFRRVMELRPNDGDVKLLDTQIASWEAGDGLSMRMTQKEYVNNSLQSDTKLSAEFAKRGDVAQGHVDLPSPTEFKLSPETIFPIEHQLKLMSTAKADGSRDVSYVFDGSSGTKVFKAISFIGKRKEPDLSSSQTASKSLADLAKVPSWPVSISFFEVKDQEDSGEQLPSYQVSFQLYENGVAQNLVMDYGDFAVSGKLSELDMLTQPDCHS